MIRAKLVIKNVKQKPLRSAIIILSLAAAAFAALFCISGINSAKNGLKDYFRLSYGDSDIVISDKQNVSTRINKDDLPEGSRYLEQSMAVVSMTTPHPTYFNYVNRVSITVLGMDTKKAAEMKLLDQSCPTENGVTITESLSMQLDKIVGDEITITGKNDKDYKFKVLSVVRANRCLTPTPVSIITDFDTANMIAGNSKGTVSMVYADVPDDKVAETMDSLGKKYPGYMVFGTTSGDSDETMSSMLNIYYLIFAVVFLMVCFIVVSMSKHIVNERMSVIGMLRSIGGSITGTGMLLLSESAFYGLCGGVLGSLLFVPLKDTVGLNWFTVATEEAYDKSDGINILTIIIVILIVTLIQCLFSAFAIVKAAKTPVRDIIFGTKDTVYIPSKVFSVIGAALIVVGVIAFYIADSFIIAIISAFCLIVGAVMLFPFLLSLCSKLLAVVFGKLKMPVARLAVREVATTKSSVSTSQLILSSITLTISMLVIAVSLISLLDSPIYQSEIIISSPSQKDEKYSHIVGGIDGVKDVECLYYQYNLYKFRAEMNGEERDLVLFGYDNKGFKYFTGIRDCPDSLSDSEAAIDKVLASKLSLKEGDEITLRFKLDSYLPREFKLKIKSLVDSGYFNSMGNTVLVSKNNYKKIYKDDPPAMVLIKTDPEKVEDILKVMRSTLNEYPSSIMTLQEYSDTVRADMSGILSIVYAVVALGFILVLMGSFSNILMGFEQSRRKYAVYYSSSMNKQKLKRLIILESMLTSGISIIFAMLYSGFFLQIVSKALIMLNLGCPLVDPVFYTVVFGVVSFFILLVVVIKPIRMLSKMNIAAEIKTSAD